MKLGDLTTGKEDGRHFVTLTHPLGFVSGYGDSPYQAWDNLNRSINTSDLIVRLTAFEAYCTGSQVPCYDNPSASDAVRFFEEWWAAR